MVNSTQLSETGMGITQTKIGKMGLIFRAIPTQDHGIDAEIEIATDGKASGRLIAAQVKTGESYFKEDTGSAFNHRLNARHYRYWTNHSLPVVLILCDADSETCYWQFVSDENCIQTGETYKIEVPKSQILDWQSLNGLIELATPIAAASDYTIVSEQDLSHSLARRIQLKTVAHPQSKILNRPQIASIARRSEKHTSELQSRQ